MTQSAWQYQLPFWTALVVCSCSASSPHSHLAQKILLFWPTDRSTAIDRAGSARVRRIPSVSGGARHRTAAVSRSDAIQRRVRKDQAMGSLVQEVLFDADLVLYLAIGTLDDVSTRRARSLATRALFDGLCFPKLFSLVWFKKRWYLTCFLVDQSSTSTDLPSEHGSSLSQAASVQSQSLKLAQRCLLNPPASRQSAFGQRSKPDDQMISVLRDNQLSVNAELQTAAEQRSALRSLVCPSHFVLPCFCSSQAAMHSCAACASDRLKKLVFRIIERQQAEHELAQLQSTTQF